MRLVVAAFENEVNSRRVREMVESAGCAKCLMCRSASEVRRAAGKERLAAVICGFKLADGPCEQLYYDLPDGCAMLMVGPRARLDLCEAEGIFKLYTPANREQLLSAVRRLLRAGGPADRRTGRENQLIDRAKALLMERRGMTEEQAHRFLQRRSMDSGAKLTQIARQVLDGE